MTSTQHTVALVTGAAGGIGSAVVRALAERGTAVAALDRDKQALEALAEEHAAAGRTVVPFAVDITSGAEVEAAVAEVEDRLGPIAHLVNGAGILRAASVEDTGAQAWEDTFAVNTRGTFLVSQAVVRRMTARRSGAVVTIASNAGATPRTGMAAYAASKAAAAMFTKSLGLEVARHGIRCNVVAPGSTDTPMLTSLWQPGQGPEHSIEGSAAEYKLGIPLRKIATPHDIAEAVVFLLSDAAGHITLETLTVDGGATLGVS